MKKIISVMLAAVMLFLLGACSDGLKAPVTIEGTKINGEIFTYFLHRIIASPESYGLDADADEKELKEAAVNECKVYLFTNTEFANSGESLTSAQKVEIAETVNNIWLRSENHFNSVGVTKQTLTKIMTAEKYEEVLFSALYDKGTQDASAEKKIQDYFYSNYVCFKTVCAYFSSASGEPMTQLEKNQMLSVFDGLSTTKAVTAEDFTKSFLDAGYQASDTVVLKKSSDGYPEGFFDSVKAQEDGTVRTVVYDDCVFAVYKENLEDKGESVYASYRSACINDLYASENESRIENAVEALTVEENQREIDKIYNRIKA